MNQASFQFAPPAALAPAVAVAATGARARHPDAATDASARGQDDPAEAIGFDHARYGRVPPAECLWPGHPVREGWERGRRLLARREREATLAVRRWLALRLAAWQRGESFDDHQITPHALRALEATLQCPITGEALADDSAVVLPLDAARGWVGGNLVLVSPRAATLMQAADADAAGATLWPRIVALQSLATPLSHEQALAQPLQVLPPNRLRLVNPVQALQALLTLQLAAPGWGQRAGRIAQSIPQGLRAEFNLFFHTLLARALQQGHGPERAAMRSALEQAWGHAAVQRRWERFARLTTPALAEVLVARLSRETVPGLTLLCHDDGVALG